MSSWSEREARFDAADGWSIGGVLRAPDGGAVPAVLMVPGSLHERDAYRATAEALEPRGLASLRIDVRGRGSSRGSLPYSRMPPLPRRRVALDVAVALDHLATAPGVVTDQLAVVTEQDTTASALEAAVADARVRAVVMLSARGADRVTAALRRRAVRVFGLVSTEDREGLRATVDGYLVGDGPGSRLEVFRGLGFGVTMMSVRQFEHPDEEPLEGMIADWLADQLT